MTPDDPHDLSTPAEATPPETPLTRWCPHCRKDVVPISRGLCSGCGRFLKRNRLAQQHFTNTALRKQHLTRLVANYQPRTTMLYETCAMLAGCLEQLHSTRPGTAPHQRLVVLAQSLTETLEHSRPCAPDLRPLADLSIEDLLARTDLMRARLLELREAPAKSVETSPPTSSPIVTTVSDPTPSSLDDTTPPDEACCEYCHQAHTACVAMKEQHLLGWRALHHDSQEEIRRRAEDAADQFEARARGWPTARMIANAAARAVPETDDEQRAREIRRQLGWECPGGTRREN